MRTNIFYQRFSSWFVAAIPETFTVEHFFQVTAPSSAVPPRKAASKATIRLMTLFASQVSLHTLDEHWCSCLTGSSHVDDAKTRLDRQWLLAALLLTVLRGVAHLFKLAVRVSYSVMAARYRSLRTECSCWSDVPIESVGWRCCHVSWQQ